MFLLIYLLYSVHILNVWSYSMPYYSHENVTSDDDLTTIYKIKDISNYNNNSGGFMSNGFLRNCDENCSIEMYLRTNTIVNSLGFKNEFTILQTNVVELFNKGLFTNESYVNWKQSSWKKETIDMNGNTCQNFNKKTTDLFFINEESEFQNHQPLCDGNVVLKYNEPIPHKNYDVYRNNFDSGYSHTVEETISIPIFDTERKNFAITYMLNSVSYADIHIIIKDENNETIFSTNLEKNEYRIKTLKITDLILEKDKKYSFSLDLEINNEIILKNFNYDYYTSNYRYIGTTEFKFHLLRIVQYSNNENLYSQIKFMNNLNRPVSINILGSEKFSALTTSEKCLNGGLFFITNEQCVCPPGFKGQFCETACGSNSFGADCKGVCSLFSNKQCRGMFMCTAYGCTCPPGLTGPVCNKNCEKGYYGNDCKQKCSTSCHNNACDQFTGDCTQGCLPGYIPPNCLEKYPYLINSPQLVSNNYETMELLLKFTSDNINGGNQNSKIKYYKILHKTVSDAKFTSSNFKLITVNDNGTKEILNDLEPDTEYILGVLVITDDGNFNDKDVVYSKFRTLCKIPQNVDYGMKLISGVNSVNVTWNKITSKRFECNAIEFNLLLTSDKTHGQSSDEEIKSSSNSGHFINDLFAGYQYYITMTPMTNYGPLQTSTTYTFSPLTAVEDVKINNIVAESTNGEKILVTWKLGNSVQNNANFDKPVTSIVRYKLNRILSCSLEELQNNWTTVTIYNQSKLEIFDTEPNSQYCVQVSVAINDENEIKQENTVYVLTPASIPKTEPIYDLEHSLSVTNNTVFFQWKFDHNNYCSKLNGFFSTFYIELKDKNESFLRVEETKQNYVNFGDLKSNTLYELRVFIKTHIGYNREHFLLANFKTKYENLKPVDDLMVYKKSLKNRMVGLRWSYLESTNLDGFIISIENDLTNNQNFTTITLNKCLAWSDYYCHTFYHLSPSNNYTFKIKPKSLDYPEGGKMSSISFNSIDGLPDPPNNLKTIEVSNTTIILQWDIPWIFNGVLKAFNINVEEVSAIDMDTCCVSITPTEIPVYEELPTYNYTLMNLKPGSTYSIGVITVSKSLWYSSPARTAVTTLL